MKTKLILGNLVGTELNRSIWESVRVSIEMKVGVSVWETINQLVYEPIQEIVNDSINNQLYWLIKTKT